MSRLLRGVGLVLAGALLAMHGVAGHHFSAAHDASGSAGRMPMRVQDLMLPTTGVASAAVVAKLAMPAHDPAASCIASLSRAGSAVRYAATAALSVDPPADRCNGSRCPASERAPPAPEPQAFGVSRT